MSSPSPASSSTRSSPGAEVRPCGFTGRPRRSRSAPATASSRGSPRRSRPPAPTGSPPPCAASAGGRRPTIRGRSSSITSNRATPSSRIRRRASTFGADYAEVLRSLGVDARVGEIPGEYCPGEYSVNVAGRIKAIGTARRVVAGAWLFSSSVVVTDPDPIRAVLTDVEAALGVAWDPTTGGSISEVSPGITVDAVADAFASYYGRDRVLTPSSPTSRGARRPARAGRQARALSPRRAESRGHLRALTVIESRAAPGLRGSSASSSASPPWSWRQWTSSPRSSTSPPSSSWRPSSSRGRLLRGRLLRRSLLRRSLLRRCLLLRRALRALLGEEFGTAGRRDRLDVVVLAQGRVRLPVGDVGTEATVLDDHRLLRLRILPELLERRLGRAAAAPLGSE